MTSKERVITAINHEEPDRVPINYSANAGIDRRLKEHFGLTQGDHEGLLQALGVDFRGLHADYKGQKLHADIPERGISVDNWGIRRRWIEHETGGYWDFCDFPLQYATEEDVANWAMPSPDDFDYDIINKKAQAKRDYCVYIGDPGVPDIINSMGMIRSMEQTLVDLAL
ncbi:MAG: hypothetical protein GX811_01570, partial [Lentisphaerae bacterium]|nr:hypothetical protein [Lentisphaerota bacterium]